MSWKKLNETYGKRGVFLALGAGVSLGSSLPTWIGLLERLSADLLGNKERFVQLRSCGFTLPAIAGILREKSDRRCGKRATEDQKKETFAESVRRALYQDFRFYPEGVGKSNRGQMVQTLKEENPTLRAVANLCAKALLDGRTGKRAFEANPKIHAVVTFNLDPLLQAYCYARYEKRLLRTIERPSASRRPGKINVYHMHGFLRFDEKSGDRTKEAPDKMVLTRIHHMGRENCFL